MKFFRKMVQIWAMAGLCLCGGGIAQAQRSPVVSFPYVSDFGTQGSPGKENENWLNYCFAFSEDTESMRKTPSIQWEFSVIQMPSSRANLAPHFKRKAIQAELEDAPAFFSPVFRMEKDAQTVYVMTVSYYVPKDGGLTTDNLYIRVHRANAGGEPFYEFQDRDGDYYMYGDPVISDKQGKVQSLLLGTHTESLREGLSTHTYTLNAGQLPETGNYRFSFIVRDRGMESYGRRGGRGNTGSPQGEFYIAELKIEERKGTDLAAGQILTPCANPGVGPQPVMAWVRNTGIGTVDAFTAYYQIDEEPIVGQEFSGMDIRPSAGKMIRFEQLPDLPAGNHRIRFWVGMSGDIHPANDTSSVYTFRIGGGYPSMPAVFDFSSPEDSYVWTAYSDTADATPSWTFRPEAGFYRPFTPTGKEDDVANDDYLVSPLLLFGEQKMYRIEFDYRAVLGSGESMQEKSLSLALGEAIFSDSPEAGNDRMKSKGWPSMAGSGEPLWLCRRFADTGIRKIVVYYYSEEAAVRSLVFRSFGPPSDGGLQLCKLSVREADTNTMNFFYDFDTYTGVDATAHALGYMDFVDQDGNLSSEGKTGTWKVYGNGSGYNSQYSVLSEGVSGETEDWIVFRPVHLEAGETYFLNLYARMSSVQKNGDLELYIRRETPSRYDLPFELQEGLKWRKTLNTFGYDTIHRAFSVARSGLYVLAIRNATSVPAGLQSGDAARDYSVFLDNISLSAGEIGSVQVVEANVPYEARLGRSVLLKMSVKNFSAQKVSADDLTYCYQVDRRPVCREKPSGGLSGQGTATYTFNRSADFSSEDDQEVKFWVETAESYSDPDTIKVQVKKIRPAELPFEESFSAVSLQEWHPYPATGKAWSLVSGSQAAHSGDWALQCESDGLSTGDYIVSPLLKVEAERTYRLSFYYRRTRPASGADGLSLYYEYDRYDLTGFRNRLAVFSEMTASEYTYCETYVRFPDTGSVFLAFRSDLVGNSPDLYIDDVMMIDSIQAGATDFRLSDLVFPREFSECDTASAGEASVSVSGRSYSAQPTVPLYISYDSGDPVRMTLPQGMQREDTVRYTFAIPKFSGGTHRVKLWLAMPYEENRSDDTVSAVFVVKSPAGIPFVCDSGWVLDNEIRRSECFNTADTGRYQLHYRIKGRVSFGEALRVWLLRYEDDRIRESFLVDTVVSGLQYQFRDKFFSIGRQGVYALVFDALSAGNQQVYSVDEIFLTLCPDIPGEDTVGNCTFTVADISLAPNPAGTYVRIGFPDHAEEIRIFDPQGRLCREVKVGRQSSPIDVGLEGLRPGIYFVRISGKEASVSVKLIKK